MTLPHRPRLLALLASSAPHARHPLPPSISAFVSLLLARYPGSSQALVSNPNTVSRASANVVSVLPHFCRRPRRRGRRCHSSGSATSLRASPSSTWCAANLRVQA
eukprot:4424192-Pleurochrysis_carterae.AAC.1